MFFKVVILVKKIVITVLLTGGFLLGTSTFTSAETISMVRTNPNNNYISPEGSKEELYQDIFMAMLNPYIQKAVNDYYGNYFVVDPFAKILSIERPNGYRTSYFIIKLQVMPYQGAHNTVGIDNITLSVSTSGAKVEKFEHIESSKITPKPSKP